ncbi:IclR family transcriptional regulator [Sulfobacillus thermosulfidooxidans]|uniref:IclR family transcriptional regulator n=1 Tax=Sulfobacillus thermosulfidooxidans TaxID=28034 RepID=UPI0006B41A92|nr:IclR family transcriptional regulator [Sulfobacillus thermosulfidooxidans]
MAPQQEESRMPSLRALERGLQLLDYLIRVKEARLHKIAEETFLPSSTTHRLLQALERHGYVTETQHGLYKLGMKGFLLTGVRESIRHVLEDLQKKTGETVNLAMLVQDEMEYVERAVSDHALSFVVSVGQRIPLNCSALGKAVLAYQPGLLEHLSLEKRTSHSITDLIELKAELEVARHRGFTLDNEEYFDGVFCVAVPVFDHSGDAIGGVSISGPTVRFSREQAFQFAPLLKASGERISQLLQTHEEGEAKHGQ